MKNKKNRVTSGLFWTFSERITAQLVSTIVMIILARILDPEHYGIISIVTVFISVCNIFVTSGFGSSVVQKKEVTETDFNTAFLLSFGISVILYCIVFFGAPYVASFYEINELTWVIRVMGLRLPLAAFNSIQHAYIQREMKFKKFFIATLFGTIISAIVGITFAKLGFGVWSLVAQYLTNTTIDSIALLFVSQWRPKLEYSREKAKYIFSFGWKVLLTNLVFTLENDIRSLIIGKVFGKSDLAYYDQGKKYPSLLVTNLNSSISKVMLPTYSRKQDDEEILKGLLRKTIRIGIYLLTPLLIGFALVSKNFVIVVLTDKWLPAVPYIQLFCVSYLTRPLESSCHQALLAIGKSDLVLRVMIVVNVFALITVIVAVFVFKSVFLIAVGSVLSSIVSLLSFMQILKKQIKYTVKEQFNDLAPTFMITIIMGILVCLIDFIGLKPLYGLILQIGIGACSYIILSKLFKIKQFYELKDKIISRKEIQ